MKNTRATYRYAKSLLELAKEQGTLEACKTDMETVVSICKDSRELMLLLKSPVVKTDKKQAIFSEIFGSCSSFTMSFIHLITQKKREALLSDIAERFLLVYKESLGIGTAVLTTATSIDEDTRQNVLDFIKKQGINQVDLTEKIDDLHKLAKALLVYETLTGDEIRDLMFKNITPKKLVDTDDNKDTKESTALGSLGLKPKPAI